MTLLRHSPTLLLALVGLGASAGAWRLACQYEVREAQGRHAAAFEQAAGSVFVAVEREAVAQLAVVHALASFFASSEQVDRHEFGTFTAPSIQRHPGLVALEWAPRVPLDQREGLDERLLALGAEPVPIVEVGPDGELHPAQRRDIYYPVVFVEPVAGNEADLGFDLGSTDKRRDTLERAADTGRIHTTELLSLTQSAGRPTAFLSVAPVYRRGAPLASVLDRRQALSGFVLGVFRIDAITRDALDKLGLGAALVGGVDLYLYDAEGLPDRPVVHLEAYDQRVSPAPALTLEEALKGVHAVHRVEAEGRSWLAVVRPVHAKPEAVSLALAWTVLLASLALTGGACLGMFVLTTRTETVSKLVEARTAQLAATTRELAERERHVRAIVDNTVDGIITIDNRGIIRSVNPAIVRMFGYRPEELIGQPMSLLMPDPHRNPHERFVQAYAGERESRVVGTLRELSGRRADGSVFPLELSVSELRQDEELAFLGVVRDISERKAVERMKDEFISTVSHELRTPLTSMLGSLELVRDGLLGSIPDQAGRMIEVAYDSGERLVRLINDILDIERVATGGLTLRHEVVDGTELLEHAARANRGFADLHGVIVARELPTGPVHIRGDRDRLLQVLTNLIGNAVKFSTAGDRVLLTLARKDQQAVFSVSDEGPGIPEAFRTQVFTPFSQADGSDRRTSGGTGLGLSIAKAIVEAHGGRIWFETVEGQGTIFYFSLRTAAGPATEGVPA